MDSSDETASDTLIKRAGSPITKKGYRKGRSPANKGKKLAPQALTPDELDRVMQSFGRTKVGARNRAMVALMARLGLKVGQVVRLQHDHYHAGGNALIVPGIQGGADRPVAVDVVTRQILDAWVEYRDVLKPGALAPFFYTVSDGHVGEEIDPGYVRDVVRNHVKKCGIRKRVSPEGLRKTFQDQASDRSRHPPRTFGRTTRSATSSASHPALTPRCCVSSTRSSRCGSRSTISSTDKCTATSVALAPSTRTTACALCSRPCS